MNQQKLSYLFFDAVNIITTADALGNLFKLIDDHGVIVKIGKGLSYGLVEYFSGRPQFFDTPYVRCLGRAEQFERENIIGVGNDFLGLSSRFSGGSMFLWGTWRSI